MANPELDQLAINTMRTLAMDAVQQANSGHPGTPMAMAPVAYSLWQRFLRFDPADPIWPNRDRFVLSAGHASMLLYSLLHLTGVKAVNPQYERLGTPSVTLDDIKRFRQLDSASARAIPNTAGPRASRPPRARSARASRRASAWRSRASWLGQHTSTGPAFACSTTTSTPSCGDGCMMEGISNEAASLAGHLKLSNLCWIYDNNHITIEGHTELAFSDDVGDALSSATAGTSRVSATPTTSRCSSARSASSSDTTDRPTLIIVDSHIAYGAPHKQDTSAAHGEPLGEEEIRLTKKNYGWPEDAKFLVPDGVREHFQAQLGRRGADARAAWMAMFERVQEAVPRARRSDPA